MSDVQRVLVGVGKANFPDTLASFSAFRVTAPFVRQSGITTGVQVRDGYREFLAGIVAEQGVLYQRVIEHKAGDILLLQATWKRRGASLRDGAIFLRLRAEAAEWEIDAKMPLDQANRIGRVFKIFRGRADILSPTDFSRYGLEVPSHYRDKFVSAEEVEECYELGIVNPEVRAAPVLTRVVDGDNVRLAEVAQPAQRRMIFRGK